MEKLVVLKMNVKKLHMKRLSYKSFNEKKKNVMKRKLLIKILIMSLLCLFMTEFLKKYNVDISVCVYRKCASLKTLRQKYEMIDCYSMMQSLKQSPES